MTSLSSHAEVWSEQQVELGSYRRANDLVYFFKLKEWLFQMNPLPSEDCFLHSLSTGIASTSKQNEVNWDSAEQSWMKDTQK